MSAKIKIIICLAIFCLLSPAVLFLVPEETKQNENQNFGATVLFPPSGGTGIGSVTTTDIGKIIMVSSSNPFTYKLGSLTDGSLFVDNLSALTPNAAGLVTSTHNLNLAHPLVQLWNGNVLIPNADIPYDGIYSYINIVDENSITVDYNAIQTILGVNLSTLYLTVGGAGPRGPTGPGVSTSTANYFTYYNDINSVTGTPLMQFTGSAITFTTDTSFGNVLMTSATSTNLSISSLANINGLVFSTASGTMITSTNAYFKRVMINTTTQPATISMQGILGEDLIRVTSSSAAAAQMFALKRDGQLVVGPNTLGQTGQLTIQSPTTNDVALSFTNGTHYTFQLGRVAGTSGLAFIGGPGGTDLNLRANAIDQVFIRRLGFMGIGSSTPNYNLSVSGTIGVVGLGTDITGNGLCITTAGRITNAGAAACVPSALKYKTNVSPYIESATQLFSSLVEIGAVENYELKSKLGDPRKGLIADLVEKVDPDLVGYSDDGSVNTLHFEDITGLTVKAVSELDKRITSLELPSKVEAKDNTVEKIQWVIIIFLFILFIKKNKK